MIESIERMRKLVNDNLVMNLRFQMNGELNKLESEIEQELNSRAERTCHIVKNSRKYVLSDGRELFDDGCSICNGYVGDGDNYCSNCGARVVGE